ncbi:MAG TPA: hypothetical protein VFZ84_22100 [Burkholderiales bacterium]
MRYASKIEYLTGSGGFAGTDGEGRPWTLSRSELIQAIEEGRMTCYVSFSGHSHLVTLKADASGRKSLATFLGEVETLPLPTAP